MKKITAVLIGAGNRGTGYGEYALDNPNEIQFIAVAEPLTDRRDKFKNEHGILEEACFVGWKELLEQPKMADAVLICTQDQMHFEPTMKALELGYHVLLEKPMSIEPGECIKMGEAAEKNGRVFSICHVLRYTNFFFTLKKILEEGKIGRLVSVQHNENVAHWHQAHSFVRGNWRNSKESSPMILQKCCHDMDILRWLIDAECKSVSSFGSLTYFKSENAPVGAPKRCLDGCLVAKECPYYGPKTYLTSNIGWPSSVISTDTSLEARTQALKEGPYGRCVYHCDNDVVDHQVVNMEFENEVTVAFTMCAFTAECSRTMKFMGTKGEIRGSMERNEIEIIDFITGNKNVIKLSNSASGHGGGDYGIMQDFVKLVQSDGKVEGRTSAITSVQSHLLAFAAEKARVENRVINMRDFINELKK
ncbi:Gfo/Idh/MocA family oxidoreductase [Clostridium estertheticum]|nr:Gfo/Idh/MocA family oxidoreductase [Clostridium estertheticum]